MAGVNINLSVATKVRAVTPSDSTDVSCQGLYVGGAGDVAITAWDDTAAQTLSAVPAGTFIPIACRLVMSTNTTATLIKALYV